MPKLVLTPQSKNQEFCGFTAVLRKIAAVAKNKHNCTYVMAQEIWRICVGLAFSLFPERILSAKDRPARGGQRTSVAKFDELCSLRVSLSFVSRVGYWRSVQNLVGCGKFQTGAELFPSSHLCKINHGSVAV